MSCLVLLSYINLAQAHNVVSGVYSDGLLIEGEVGFSNGDMAAAGFTVEILDEAGQLLGTTKTEADGVFSYRAASAQQHIFKVDLGSGHVANMVLEADELTDVAAPAQSIESATVQGEQIIHSQAVSGVTVEALESMVRSAVAQQIRPLQKEIRAYKERVFIRDIAGGLGFIFGLFGVAAWVASRRDEAKS